MPIISTLKESGSAGRRAALIGAGFFLIMAAWVFAAPLQNLDEPAQVIKAAATVRLESGATVQAVSPGAVGLVPGPEVDMSVFTVPDSYAVTKFAPCYIIPNHISPRCLKPMSDSGREVTALSYVGNYDPLYYLLVGWPSLLTLGAKSVYAMRLCSAILDALLLTLAAWVALTATSRRIALCLAAAVTPMITFLGGTVNPNSTEACAAILAWSGLLGAAFAPRGDIRRIRACLGPAMVGLLFLTTLRMLGPLWSATAISTAALAAPRVTIRAACADRRVRFYGLTLGLVTAGAVAWTAAMPMEIVPMLPTFYKPLRALRDTFDRMPHYLAQMIFQYGWGEVFLPTLALVVFMAVYCLLIVPVAIERRIGLLTALMCVGLFAVPMAIQGLGEQSEGQFWQGRYLLAFAVGLPLLAGFTAQRHPDRVPPLSDSAFKGLILFLGVGHLTCFWWAMRRNANRVGANAQLLPNHAYWTPPLGWYTVLAVFVLGLALVGAVLWRLHEDGMSPTVLGGPRPRSAADDLEVELEPR
jgi:hypothetical protein